MTPAGNLPRATRSSMGRAAAPALVAVVLAIGAYANSLHGGFTFDDRAEVVENASITDLGIMQEVLWGHGYTRPVVNLSYAIDFAWNGRDAFGYHLTNLVLHAANVLLLFLAAQQLARSARRQPAAAAPDIAIAFAAAGLLAVHPMMTEAVSYVSGRAEVLATTFFLASFYCFRRGFEGARFGIPAGAVLFVLALGSKETAATLPFVLLASDVLLPSCGNWRKRRSIHLPLIVVVCAAGIARIWLHVNFEYRNAGNAFTWNNVVLQAEVVVRYIGLLFVPRGQTIVHPVAPITTLNHVRVAIAALALGAAILLIALTWKRLPLVALGVIWFFLALLPSSVLTLLTPYGQSMSEHRVYLASCAFFLAIAASAVRSTQLVSRWVGPARAVLGASAAVVLASLLVATVARNRVWADPIRVWQEAVNRSPGAMFAHLGLGQEYRIAGRCRLAEPAFREAIRLAPNRPPAYLGLAACLIQQRRIVEARDTLRTALDSAPRDLNVLVRLGEIEERGFGRRAEALRLCREALAIDPASGDATECVERNDAK
jgi:tetratricopeptide (TPR) repeat protein